MRIAKILTTFITFIITFFVNLGWFFDYCSRNFCPDSYGPSPLVSLTPNFYSEQKCGGFMGNCIPSHWSISTFIFDLILWVLLTTMLFYIINKLSGQQNPRTLNK